MTPYEVLRIRWRRWKTEPPLNLLERSEHVAATCMHVLEQREGVGDAPIGDVCEEAEGVEADGLEPVGPASGRRANALEGRVGQLRSGKKKNVE